MQTRNSNEATSTTIMSFWRRRGGWIICGGLALLGAVLLWYLLAGTASMRREAPETAMLMLPPPPPPPPEPEKLPEPEPEKIEPQITEVEPTPVEPQDKPMDEPESSPAPDAGDPVTMNADAQAGTGGVLVGSGGGSTGGGGGMGGRFYERYVTTLLQQALARDPRTRNLAFSDIRVDIWLASDGRATRVQLAQGTGDARIDEAVMALLSGIEKLDERPPQSMRFPMRVSMRGSRPS